MQRILLRIYYIMQTAQKRYNFLWAVKEEGAPDTAQGQNTRTVRLGGKPKRMACLLKKKASAGTKAAAALRLQILVFERRVLPISP